MKTKTFTQFSFFTEGYSYAIRSIILENGSFKNKSSIRTVYTRKGSKHQIRDTDRKYLKALGVDIKNKEVHHDWNNGGQAFVLTPEQHLERRTGLY